MYFVYILYSSNIDKYYVGQTENLERRLSEYNSKRNLGASDWKIKYVENFENRSDAVKRESEIKAKKRRTYVEWLIAKGL
jgi:putative endonuclease